MRSGETEGNLSVAPAPCGDRPLHHFVVPLPIGDGEETRRTPYAGRCIGVRARTASRTAASWSAGSEIKPRSAR